MDSEERTSRYAQSLGRMIRVETVSSVSGGDTEKFRAFRALLHSLFPHLFGRGEYMEFSEGFVLKWPGRNPDVLPVLFMNHHDVVEANGAWRHGPFSGEIAESS